MEDIQDQGMFAILLCGVGWSYSALSWSSVNLVRSRLHTDAIAEWYDFMIYFYRTLVIVKSYLWLGRPSDQVDYILVILSLILSRWRRWCHQICWACHRDLQTRHPYVHIRCLVIFADLMASEFNSVSWTSSYMFSLVDCRCWPVPWLGVELW